MAHAIIPTSARFFLADDIRVEIGGKTTLQGLYPDDIILIDLPSGMPSPSITTPIQIEGFGILASFDRGFGSMSMDVRLSSPNGEVILEAKGGQLKAEKDGPVTFAGRFRPFIVSSVGTYEYFVTVDGKAFTYSFNIKINAASGFISSPMGFTEVSGSFT